VKSLRGYDSDCKKIVKMFSFAEDLVATRGLKGNNVFDGHSTIKWNPVLFAVQSQNSILTQFYLSLPLNMKYALSNPNEN
jgi:hypothetical protein